MSVEYSTCIFEYVFKFGRLGGVIDEFTRFCNISSSDDVSVTIVEYTCFGETKLLPVKMSIENFKRMFREVDDEVRDKYIVAYKVFKERWKSLEMYNGLLPCPCCKGAAEIYEEKRFERGRGYVVACVRCKECGMQTGMHRNYGYFKSKEHVEDAKNVWNNRS